MKGFFWVLYLVLSVGNGRLEGGGKGKRREVEGGVA